MKEQELSIPHEEIKVGPQEIQKLLGLGQEGSDSFTEELIDTCIQDCMKIMEPRAGIRILEALKSSNRNCISTPELEFKTGRMICKLFKEAGEYWFFIATAGPGPELHARTFISEGNYPEGYICDLVGSAIAESVVEWVQKYVSNQVKSRNSAWTNHYSPGYCGWNTKEQQKLFSLFPEGFCGIGLSSSSLMTPIKSLSGVIATGPGVKFRDYNCELCSMKDCFYRQTR